MTERRMMVTLGHRYYVGHPSDIAALIEICDRLLRVDHAADYMSMVMHREQEPPVQAVSFARVDYSLPIEPQPNAAVPNAIEPAPAPAPEPQAEFRMTNETASWEDWLAQARHIEAKDGGEQSSDGFFRAWFDRGETPERANEMPF